MVSCADSDQDIEKSLLEIPAHFPPVEWPEDNAFTLARWEMGKALFYDPVLSKDSSISCASCHRPERAFADNRPFSLGVADSLGRRNVPTLTNVAYNPYFLSEGGVPTLELQVIVPIQDHAEFDFNIVAISERLKRIPKYMDMAQKAYNREPDPFAITRSISTFERTFISGNSPYDRYVSGDKSALSAIQKKGMDLFFSDRVHCTSCHGGFNFTDYGFENNGLYETYRDKGRYALTGKDSDVALFKVPTLRNVGHTAPYMHDGSMLSLVDVVKHYSDGIKLHHHLSEEIKPLLLNDEEVDVLVAFLGALTDNSFSQNQMLRKH